MSVTAFRMRVVDVGGNVLQADEREILPTGLDEHAPKIPYLNYFQSLKEILSWNDGEPLRTALAEIEGHSVAPDALNSVTLESIKHGAFYHVARVEVETSSGDRHAFALNTAVTPTARKALDREWLTLRALSASPVKGYIPRCFWKGGGECSDLHGVPVRFACFLAQWFEGFHEWHFVPFEEGRSHRIQVWDGTEGGRILSKRDAGSVLATAARILTLGLDRRSFEHIFPWHHAAGDFIVRTGEGGIQLRLVSARGRQVWVPAGKDLHERLAAAMSFLFGLSFRLRIDRIGGTGPLVWLDFEFCPPIIEGFFQGWSEGQGPERGKETEALKNACRKLSAREWLLFGEVLEDRLVVDPEEKTLVSRMLPAHARDLARVFSEL